MDKKIMYCCEDCADNMPEQCGHFDRTEVRVAPDGRWLCEDCYDDDVSEDAPNWSSCPPAPEHVPAS
jgi:hypothetical protein